MEYLQQTWVIVAAAIGGITLLWNFIHKTFGEIKSEIMKPFNQLNDKIDNLEGKMNEFGHHNNIVKSALLTMQRNSLLRSCEEFLDKGFATANEKQTISEQYTSYSELGGDSFISDLVAEVMRLPLNGHKSIKKRSSKKIEEANETK